LGVAVVDGVDAGEEICVLDAAEVGDTGLRFAGVGTGEVVGGGCLGLLADGAGGRDWRRAISGGDGDAVVAAAGEELVAGDELALVGFESEDGRLEAAGAAKGTPTRSRFRMLPAAS